MKFVLFSDLHLDSPFQWAGPSLGRKLRLGLRETLDRICRLAVDEGADALLCAGDLYEQESFTPDTAEYLRSSFEKLTPLQGVHRPRQPRLVRANGALSGSAVELKRPRLR